MKQDHTPTPSGADNTEEQLRTDELYMRRCLQLARNGMQNAKPNPMVGAVVVSREGRIIGEGYHVQHGLGHAEVNAFASVCPADEALLREATLYVSLEPCAHRGKTPPCADLIIAKGVRRVVCGCIDPFAKVQGRGVERIRRAGIEVTVGVLEEQCLALNRRFVTFNTKKRPYIILKWAQTENGKMAATDTTGSQPLAISGAFTKMLVHKLRAENDAILVGHETVRTDHPRLNTRLWSGRDPERLVLARRGDDVPKWFSCFGSIDEALQHLYDNRKQSLIVEGGAATLNGFLARGLWDEIRVETAPFCIDGGIDAPTLPTGAQEVETRRYDGNIIRRYEQAASADQSAPATNPKKH